MLSIIGLAFDLVGAVTLVLGLFRPPRPLFVGWAHSPDEAARDAAFGVSGGTLLAFGFTFQSLAYFGVHVHCVLWARIVITAAALIAGIVYTVGVFDLAFLLVYRRERDRLGSKFEKEGITYPPLKREPKGLRLWRHVPDWPPQPRPP